MNRAAIVGAGPSGFYAADALLKAGFAVDVFDALPTPYGLVRAGVAPDHPKIKSVIRVYAKTAAHESFRFFGGVSLGVEISPQDLLARYHAVIYAVGTSTDNRLGIPGEDRPGSHAATEFVAWYNGHPHFADHMFDLNGGRAVVIGNGNVAIDVARMLVLDPAELAADRYRRPRPGGVRRGRGHRGGPAGPPWARRGGVHQPRAARAGRAAARRRDRGPGAARGRRSARGRRRHQAPQRRDPARLRPARADRQVPPARAALPALAGRDPGRRGGRAGDRRARGHQPAGAQRTAGSGPSRPARPRTSSAASSCARSATGAPRWRASRSTTAAG